VGIVPGIDALAEAGSEVSFWRLSLHAPDVCDNARCWLPMKPPIPVSQIIAAAAAFERTADRRVPTIEYCMLADVNDSEGQANECSSSWSAECGRTLNLFPTTPPGAWLSGRTYQRPSAERVDRFLGLCRWTLWPRARYARRRCERRVRAVARNDRSALRTSPLYSD